MLLTVVVAIAQPQQPHRTIPPDSSQSLPLLKEGLSFFFSASRAASTHALGIPASGTGTATHSSLGSGTELLAFLYTFPPGFRSEVCLVLCRSLPHHQIP